MDDFCLPGSFKGESNRSTRGLLFGSEHNDGRSDGRLRVNPSQVRRSQCRFYQLFDNRSIYNSVGIGVAAPGVDVNPDLDTLTFTGRVPGITSSAVFSFDMEYFESTADKPDNLSTSEGTSLPLSCPSHPGSRCHS